MRWFTGIAALMVAFLALAGCGGGSRSTGSTATAGPKTDGEVTKSGSSSQAHLPTTVERQEKRDSHAGASEAEAALVEVEEDKSISGGGSYSGIDLCDLDQIEEEVRVLYNVDPSTEVICRPAKSQEGVVAAWNWWVVQPKEHYRAPETKAEAKIQEQMEELVGEKATSERIEVGIADNRANGENVWAKEKEHVANPANELELIEVNGSEAIWGANYLLLTPISEDQLLSIAVLSGYTQSGPIEGEPTAISLAELVENEAF